MSGYNESDSEIGMSTWQNMEEGEPGRRGAAPKSFANKGLAQSSSSVVRNYGAAVADIAKLGGSSVAIPGWGIVLVVMVFFLLTFSMYTRLWPTHNFAIPGHKHVAGYDFYENSGCGRGVPLHVWDDQLMLNGCQTVMKQDVKADLLSHGKSVHVTDDWERAANLLKSDDSEWWTPQNNATITVNLQMIANEVTKVSIEWWGISWTDNVEIQSSIDGVTWRTQRTEKDWDVKPTDYNQYTHWPGWREETRYVRFQLAHGHEDPWNMHEKIGIRRIEVHGKSRWTKCGARGEECACDGQIRTIGVLDNGSTHTSSIGSVGESICGADVQGLNHGECFCRASVPEVDAAAQCRRACSGNGHCSGFEYVFSTNAKNYGSQCCFTASPPSPEPIEGHDCFVRVT